MQMSDSQLQEFQKVASDVQAAYNFAAATSEGKAQILFKELSAANAAANPVVMEEGNDAFNMAAMEAAIKQIEAREAVVNHAKKDPEAAKVLRNLDEKVQKILKTAGYKI